MPTPTAAEKRAAKLRRWERYSRVARRVGTAVGGPLERRIERYLLQRAWIDMKSETLRKYLVGSYQNPIINVQSILARHEIVREATGDAHEGIMQQELRWAVEKNRELRRRQHDLPGELGVDFREVKRSGKWRAAYQEIMQDSGRFAAEWTRELGSASDPARPKLAVIEAACGSANDYRFFDRYGMAPLLDYTGFDLTETNIANAHRMFPGVDFRIGDVQDIAVGDRSYDWAVAHDLLEHLSPHAFERAIDELCRVTRRGVLISFFYMRDRPEHEVTPRRTYHMNELSKDRIEQSFARHCSDIRWVHVRPWLAEHFGFDDYYNWRAWTVIARH